jgi:hypothetical protein
MGYPDRQLFLAGLFSGFLVGVLGALLARRRDEEAPLATGGGLVLPRRADQVVEQAERAAAEAVARARRGEDAAGL